jgi:subtilisin family serine protease
MEVGRTVRGCLVALSGWLIGCSGSGDAPAVTTKAAAASQPTVSAPAKKPPTSSRKSHAPAVVPGEYLVKFRAPTSVSYAESALQSAALDEKRRFHSVAGLYHVVARAGTDPRTAATRLAHDASVEYIEPNFRVHASAIPNDTLYSQQWALNTALAGNINAPAAWNLTTGSAKVVLAVIDTGIDYTHPDLAANVWVNPPGCAGDDTDGYPTDCHGINAITGSGDPMDDNDHGTHVSGIMGAVGNNDQGVAGVNWSVSLLGCKFLDSTGSGATADAITCLDYIAATKNRGVNIVASNNSWGSSTYSRALSDAIAAQRQLGILFIAAAGNNTINNDQSPQYPCSYDHSNIICVAASQDGLTDFSDYGVGTVHLAAPGQGILSTVLGGKYDAYDGTSMATPFVTGTAGLLSAQDPTRDWRAIKNLILAGAAKPTQGTILTLTGGTLNAANSMTCQNSTVTARMRPPVFETITLAVGGSLELEAINIKCAIPNGNVTVDVEPGGETLSLVDDGTGNDEAAGDGIYTGAWTPTAGGNYTLTFQTGDIVKVLVDPLLKAGFPTQMYVQPDSNGQTPLPAAPLVVGNLDGEPGQQILAPGYVNGPLYAWRSDGTAQSGWPNYDFGETVEVSLGSFASGAPNDVVVTGYYTGDLGIYAADDTAVSGWPQSTSNNYYPAPTVDLNGTGVDTIISYPAYNANGTLFKSNIPPPAQTGPIAVADLDAVGQFNFVSASYNTLWASSTAGMKPGFPVTFPSNFDDIYSNVVIGDVDGDGKPEIIVSGLQAQAPDGQGSLHLEILIYNTDGVLLRSLATPAGPVSNSLVALADLDGDGIPEIVTGTGPYIYAWKGDGSTMPGFPISIGGDQYAGPIVVGDIDGDGYPDVISMSSGSNSTSGQLNALDRHGGNLTGFPRPILYMAGATTPAIADLDGSGRNNLILAATPYVGLRDAIFAYDLHGTGPFGPIEWGQYMGGANHLGYYQTGKNLAKSAYLTTQVHGAGVITSSDAAINCGATCIHSYPNGSKVKLAATAATGGRFNQWFGACAGQPNPCMVTVNQYTAVSADLDSPVTVSVVGSGAVTSTPTGINCPAASCTAEFMPRTEVTLTAVASNGVAFNGWQGACSGATTTCTLAINEARTTIAQFGGPSSLSIELSGNGSARITSSPAGINCPSTCTAVFPTGTVVKLSAALASDSYLQDWGVSGCSASESTCSVTLGTDTSIVVVAAPKVSISISLPGKGSAQITSSPAGISCPSTCNAAFLPGTLIKLSAAVASNSYLQTWGLSGCTSSASTCSITLDADTSIAVAVEPKVLMPVTISGQGSVMIAAASGSSAAMTCSTSCSYLYQPGISLSLTASPNSNSQFSRWSGACSGTSPTCTFTPAASATVSATFTAKPSAGGGGGALDRWSCAVLVLLFLSRARKAVRAQYSHRG